MFYSSTVLCMGSADDFPLTRWRCIKSLSWCGGRVPNRSELDLDYSQALFACRVLTNYSFHLVSIVVLKNSPRPGKTGKSLMIVSVMFF